MHIGFNLKLDENDSIFGGEDEYRKLQEKGEKHLDAQKAVYQKDLKKYVNQNEIDGTKIQNEWFPQVKADIFISHSHKDTELACALAGWINKNFGLRCFIDSNVWGYSEELLSEMNANLSDREEFGGRYLYDLKSCNMVSQHVNTMLSIALQKMIDKVEAVILLNTERAVTVHSDTQMEKTYSPWIYSEIICTQFIRKKPLLAYRNYTIEHQTYEGIYESVQYAKHLGISYDVSLKHLKELGVEDLELWNLEYGWHNLDYEYPLDALYKFMCPNEVENTKKMFCVLEDGELRTLQHAYSTQGMDADDCERVQDILDGIINGGLLCCRECNRYLNG